MFRDIPDYQTEYRVTPARKKELVQTLQLEDVREYLRNYEGPAEDEIHAACDLVSDAIAKEIRIWEDA